MAEKSNTYARVDKGLDPSESSAEAQMEFQANMNILPENKSNLYASGTVTIDRLFVIHDVKVIYLQKEGMDEKQLTICMPRHYNKKTESWDQVIQLTKEQRKDLEKAVIADLSQKIGSSIESPEEYCSIQINICDPSLAPTLGYAEVSYRDMLCMKKVRIAEGSDGHIQIFLPANRNKDGSYSTLFGMVTSDHQKRFEESIRAKFKEVYREVTGKEFEGTVSGNPFETADDIAQEENQPQEHNTQEHTTDSPPKTRHGR